MGKPITTETLKPKGEPMTPTEPTRTDPNDEDVQRDPDTGELLDDPARRDRDDDAQAEPAEGDGA